MHSILQTVAVFTAYLTLFGTGLIGLLDYRKPKGGIDWDEI